MEKMEKIKILYKNQAPQRVDKFLLEFAGRLNRSDVQRFIRLGNLKVNGKVVKKTSLNLRKSDRVEFVYGDLSPLIFELPVQFENKDLLVVEKPAGAVVFPTKKTPQASLAGAISQKYPKLKSVGPEKRFGIVHRLDKETSGLVLVAKNNKIYKYLTRLFAKREIIKEYQTLVYGKLTGHKIIDKPLTKIGQRGSSKVRVDDEGKEARTEYWAIEHYVYRGLTPLEGRRAKSTSTGALKHLTSNGVDSYSLVRVKLHTGRTHQIRVHFSDQRHPVMGDTLYGKPQSQRLKEILDRQFLHATKLEFQLPDKTWLTVESSLASDLKKTLKKLNKITT